MNTGRSAETFVSVRTFILKRFRLVALAPLLALVVLSAWAFASPVASSPDDDFHLVSIWCSTGNDAYCQAGSADENRLVPYAVLKAPCFKSNSFASAACQDSLDFESSEMIQTKRGNFSGAYPPLYYSVMSVFVGPDVQVSVLAMRIFNIILFIGITTSLYLLLPRSRRPALVWGWLITTMPLGVFLLASNNPSAWAIAGVGSAWLALLGFYESRSRAKRWSLGALVVVSVLMAAGSRGDSAVYVVGALGVAAILAFTNTRTFWMLSILPAVLSAVAVGFFLSARQTASGVSGFTGGDAVAATEQTAGVVDSLSGFALFAYNLLSIPFMWLGAFGGWPLGWIDTPLPVIVMFLGVAAFIGVGFVGLSILNGRKVFVVAAVGLVLTLLPIYVLTQGGDTVGEEVQPRYILPLIVLFGGVLIVQVGRKAFALSRVQAIAVVFVLSVANLVALHMNIRRYVTGIDAPGWNLNAGAEWFWSGAPAPMVVWAIGTIAFAALATVLARDMFLANSATPSVTCSEEIVTESASR